MNVTYLNERFDAMQKADVCKNSEPYHYWWSEAYTFTNLECIPICDDKQRGRCLEEKRMYERALDDQIFSLLTKTPERVSRIQVPFLHG